MGRGIAGGFLGAAMLVVGLIILFSTYYTVDQGERAVVLHFGEVVGESEPGFHVKMPFMTSVEHISIQPMTYTYGNNKQTPLVAYSQDQQPAGVVVSVTFHVTDVRAVYAQYGSIDRMVQTIFTPRVYENLKNVFGQFNAIEAIQTRAKLNAQLQQAIVASIKGPFVVDSVQIQDIEFSKT